MEKLRTKSEIALKNPKNEFDPAALAKEQEKIFSSIENTAANNGLGEIDWIETKLLMGRIFEHSIEDGIKIAEKLMVTPLEITNSIINPVFVLKHHAFNEKLLNKIKNNTPYISKQHDFLKEKILDSFLPKEVYNFNEVLPEIGMIFGQSEIKTEIRSPQAKKILDDIDKYYAKFLGVRNLKFSPEEKERQVFGITEKVANQLRKIEAVMEGRYLAGEIKKIIFDHVKDNDDEFLRKEAGKIWKESELLQDKYKNPEEFLEQSLKKNKGFDSDTRQVAFDYIRHEIPLTAEVQNSFKNETLLLETDVKDVLRRLGLDAEKIKTKLKNAEYTLLDITYNMEKKMNEEGLVEILNETLDFHKNHPGHNGKEQEVFLNPKTDVYEIKEKENSASENNSGETNEEKTGKDKWRIEKKETKEVKIPQEAGFGYGNIVNGEVIIRSLVNQHRGARAWREDGTQIGSLNEGVRDVFRFGHKKELAYIADHNGGSMVVDEHGHQLSPNYNTKNNMGRIWGPVSMDKGFALIERHDDSSETIMAYGVNINYPMTTYNRDTDKIHSIVKVDENNLALWVARGDKYVILTSDEKVIEDPEESIYSPVYINGRFVYQVEKKGKIVIEDEFGKTFGEQYDNCFHPFDLDGTIAFNVEKDNREFFVTENGDILSEKYDRHSVLDVKFENGVLYIYANVNGKRVKDILTLKKSNKKNSFTDLEHNIRQVETGTDNLAKFSAPVEIIITSINGVSDVKIIGENVFYSENYHGKEFINFSAENISIRNSPDSKNFDKGVLQDIADLDGKPVFLLRRYEGYEIMFDDGTKHPLFKQYEKVYDFKVVDGRILFVGEDKNGNKHVHDFKRYQMGGEGHKSMQYSTIVDGKLVVVAQDSDGSNVIIREDKSPILFSKTDHPNNLTSINNKLVFVLSREKHGTEVRTEDGKKFSEDYLYIGQPFDYNGKIAFFRNDGKKVSISIEDEQEIMVEKSNWDDVWHDKPIVIGNEIVFQARDSANYHYLVTNNGWRVSSGFENIKFFKKEGNKIIIVGQKGNSLVKEVIDFELKNESIDLMPDEKWLLELLNLLHKPELEKIKKYFEDKKPKEENLMQKIRKELGESQTFLNTLAGAVKNAPKAFLDTIAAKKDRAVDHLVDKVLFKIFPEIYEDRAQQNRRSGRENLWGEMGNLAEPRAENYLESMSEISFEGGDPAESEKGISKEVLHLREPMREMIASGIYGKYDGGKWSKVMFPIEFGADEPTKEITMSIPDVSKVSRVNLSKTLDSKIISERIKGITADGKEIPLEVEVSILGEGVVLDKKKAKEIVYSIEKNLIPTKMPNLDNVSYESYKKLFSKNYGADLLEGIADLPEELNMFVDSLEEMSPKEKVFAIEKFVRDNSFYDMENAEVTQIKAGKSIEEKIMIMEERLEVLRERMPEYGEQLSKKKYAGVCADFNILTASLLRRAGILSGVVDGFMPSGKVVTTADAHGVAFVLFPDDLGKNKIFTVDGTPRGISKEQEMELVELGILTQSLAEKDEAADKEISEAEKKAEEEIKNILEIIESQNEDEIKKLTNGRLESALNNILRYSVKIRHLESLRKVLESYWYTPISSLDLDNPENRKEIGEFFKSELGFNKEELKKDSEFLDKPAGSHLFETIRSFAERFAVQNKTKNIAESYTLLENIFELAKNELDSTERKAITAIITYLKAKKMVS